VESGENTTLGMQPALTLTLSQRERGLCFLIANPNTVQLVASVASVTSYEILFG